MIRIAIPKKHLDLPSMQIGFLMVLLFAMHSPVFSQKIIGKKSVVKELKNSFLLKQSHTGLVVHDISSDQRLVDYHGGKNFTPASNVKIITFLLTDQIIGDSLVGIKFDKRNDTLVFSGTGDPSFLHPRFKAQPVFDFLRAFEGILAYRPARFKDKRFGPGWAWDDYPYYFQQEKSEFPIYGNSVWFTKSTEASAIEILPEFFRPNTRFYDSMESQMPTRLEVHNQFQIENAPKLEEVIPFHLEDHLAIKLLEDTLQSKIIITDKTGANWNFLMSIPKDTLLKEMMVESDNFMAEQLLLQSSAVLFDTLDSNKMIDWFQEKYFTDDSNKIRWVDGSGLSRYNSMSPSFFTEILIQIYQNNDFVRIKSLFPAGGKQGTLVNFLNEEVPFIYAKSGSMTGVYNLSGYLISDKNNILAFSFMNNNFTHSIKEVKGEVERLLRTIKEKY